MSLVFRFSLSHSLCGRCRSSRWPSASRRLGAQQRAVGRHRRRGPGGSENGTRGRQDVIRNHERSGFDNTQFRTGWSARRVCVTPVVITRARRLVSGHPDTRLKPVFATAFGFRLPRARLVGTSGTVSGWLGVGRVPNAHESVRAHRRDW